jgi:hypothetical protein
VLQSKSEDLVISLIPLRKDGQPEDPLTSAQREESTRLVTGVGRDVRAIVGGSEMASARVSLVGGKSRLRQLLAHGVCAARPSVGRRE